MLQIVFKTQGGTLGTIPPLLTEERAKELREKGVEEADTVGAPSVPLQPTPKVTCSLPPSKGFLRLPVEA